MTIGYGFLTMELLVALGVFAFTLSSVVTLAWSAQSVGVDADRGSAAAHRGFSMLTTYAAEAKDWDAFPNDDFEEDAYSGWRTATAISPCAKLLRASLVWDGGLGRPGSSVFETVSTNSQESMRMGGSCSPVIPGAWDNPEMRGSIALDTLTGIALTSVGGKHYALVIGEPYTEASHDFFVVDVTDTDNPLLITGITIGDGLQDIAVGDGFAYVVEDTSEDQLIVVDVRDPSEPQVVTYSSLPGVDPDPEGSYPGGVSVSFYDSRVYVGTKETAGPEFHLFDVSNPQAPNPVGSLEINHNVNDIAVYGNFAYLATSADYAELTVIDVHDPSALTLPANYMDGAVNQLKFNALNAQHAAQAIDGTRVSVLYPYVYLGFKRASGVYGRDFYVVSIDNASDMTEKSALQLGLASGSHVTGIHAQYDRVFISADDDQKSLIVADVSNATKPALIDPCGLRVLGSGTGLAYADRTLYGIYRTGESLRIFTDQPSRCTI